MLLIISSQKHNFVEGAEGVEPQKNQHCEPLRAGRGLEWGLSGCSRRLWTVWFAVRLPSPHE